MGKRRCVGEVLARAELFLFVAAMVERFKITSAKIPASQLTLTGVPGLVFFPKPFEFQVDERT